MTNNFFRVCFVCSRLDLPGGMERAIVNTANLLQSNGYEVVVLVLDETAGSFYPLHPHVTIRKERLHFGITAKGNVFSRKLDLIRHTRRLQKRLSEIEPDAVITTEYQFTIAACLGTGKWRSKVYAWEHHHFHHLDKSSFWRLLQKKIYPKVRKVICLNAEEARLFQNLGCHTVVIPNFVEPGVKAPLEKKRLLTIGWLSRTKGVDLIPEIARRLLQQDAEWHWSILGKGDEENELRAALEKWGLQDYVSILPPVKHNISQDYLSASVYVMTSRFECFPMVLLEAFSHGIPAVAFDCPTGPKHIISDGIDGYLVEPDNRQAMANVIGQLLQNEGKRRDMGTKAYQNIARFSKAEVYPLLDALLQQQSLASNEQ